MNTAVPAPDSPRLPEGNVAGHLERLARSKGWWDRTAYLVGSDTFTFADVHEGAARAAGVLAARGVGLGSRVLLALPVGTSFVWGVWGYLGALRLGAVVLPLTPGTSAENLTAAVASAPPQLAVCDEPLGLPGVPELAGSQLTDRRAPLVPWQRLPAPTRAFECCDFSWRDTPCLYAHRHCDALVFDQAAHTAMGLDPADVCLSRSPLTTAFGLGNAILLPLLRGSTTVLCDTTAQAGESLAHIRRHGVTVFVTPPPRKRGGFSLDRMGSHDGQALTAAEAGS
ncbi:AMP-binding protein, partial [Streptomyces sp. NPDC005231]